MIEGAVDLVTIDGAIGWLGEKEGESRFEVAAILRGQIIGEAVAELVRPDLAHAGFNEGRCGFELSFHSKLPEREIPFVSFHPKGSQLSLPRSAPELYCEALHAVTADFPAAGRHRSLYGGLWSDRTDALQIVRGRGRAGFCDPATMAALHGFIINGFAELRTEGARLLPTGLVETFAEPNPAIEPLREAAAALAAYAFAPATVTLLEALFDDAPVFHRPETLTAATTFAQAAAFEAMSSPAELVIAYVPLSVDGARLDYLLDSHEWPEFAAGGASRWSPRGAGDVARAVDGRNAAVQSRDLDLSTVALVGPGLIHRIIAAPSTPVLRLALSPQRVSPLRHVSEDWVDVPSERGVRGRV